MFLTFSIFLLISNNIKSVTENPSFVKRLKAFGEVTRTTSIPTDNIKPIRPLKEFHNCYIINEKEGKKEAPSQPLGML